MICILQLSGPLGVLKSYASWVLGLLERQNSLHSRRQRSLLSVWIFKRPGILVQMDTSRLQEAVAGVESLLLRILGWMWR